MGDRVTRSGQRELARARRLQKALQAGVPPTWVQPETALQAASSCSAQSCPVPSLAESSWKNPLGADTRLQFLEQMFQASPDGLCIADNGQRVLWASDQFVRMFGYESAEVIGQPLESLV